jgi:Flp pilus assembly protein TadG
MALMRRRTSSLARWFIGRCSDDAGASAVEFAIIAPVMLMLVFGIFEFGRFFWTQNALQYAVEETARQSLRSTPAISDCATSVANTAAVTTNLVALKASSATVTLASATVTGSSLATQPKVCTITITYPFSFLGLAGFSAAFNATGVAAFPCGSGTTCS